MAGIAAIISALFLGSPHLANAYVVVTNQRDLRAKRNLRLVTVDADGRKAIADDPDPPRHGDPLAG